MPKHIFRSSGLNLNVFCWDVFGGTSFWFTSAMVVCQLVLLTALLCKCRKLWHFIILSLGIVAIMPLLKSVAPNAFPWYWKTGLAAVVFMTLGGIIYTCRQYLRRYINVLSVLAILGYIAGIIYGARGGNAAYAMMSVTFNWQGILVTLAGIAMIFIVSYRWIPNWKALQFIGKNSILFYFFSGILPASISSLCVKVGLYGNIYAFFVVVLLSVFVGYLLTYIVVRWLPWLTDVRKLWASE